MVYDDKIRHSRTWCILKKKDMPFLLNNKLTIKGKMKQITIIILLAISSAVYANGNLEKVKLQLKWYHSFQFAGYYAAVEKGFYKDAGLDVELIEGKTNLDCSEMLLSEKADYVIAMPNMLLDFINGKPVVALAAIFQHNPFVLMTRSDSGLSSPHDLINKKVLMNVKDNASMLVMFKKEGINLNKINIGEMNYDYSLLENKEVDAMIAYKTNEPFVFKEKGIETNIINPKNYGIDFYGDCLFTSKKKIDNNPEQVTAFHKASLKGWEYAMSHSDEIISLIKNKYKSKKSVNSLKFEASEMQSLIMPKFVKIGFMNKDRWEHIAEIYKEAGLIKGDYSLDGFIYNPQKKISERNKQLLLLTSAVSLVIFVISIILVIYNRKLKKSDKRLTWFSNIISEAIFISEKGICLEANKTASKMFGYEHDELIGIFGADLFTEESKIIVEKNMLENYSLPYDAVAVKKDGTEFDVEIHGDFFEFNGKKARITSVKNISIRKEKERELKLTKKFLEEQIIYANSMVEQTQKATEVKAQFLANMSHEIRTPLNGICGIIQLLEKTALSEEQKEYLKTMDYSSERLLTLINDILDISKIEAGKMEVVKDGFNLADVINNMRAMFHSKLQENNITFEIKNNIDSKNCYLTDVNRLQQILINLINNAIKFTKDGEVTLEINEKKRDENNSELHFSVIDNGIGISEKNQLKLFSDFVQADSSTTKKFGGTGLGLSISKKLTELLGGEISVSSKLGKGSVFSFFIKAENTDTITRSFKRIEKNVEIENLKVLLVEDSQTNQMIAKNLLECIGCVVDVAENGKIALEKIYKKDYGIVFMDIQMPVMDGITATCELRKNAKYAELPIIALTANNMAGDKERFLQDGMTGFIPKPLKEIELKLAIAEHANLKICLNEEKEEVANDKKDFDFNQFFIDIERNTTLFQEFVSIYMKETSSYINKIEKAISEENYADIDILGHSLKGSSLNLYAYNLANVAGMIEVAGKEKNIKTAKSALPKLKEEFELLKIAISASELMENSQK